VKLVPNYKISDEICTSRKSSCWWTNREQNTEAV